MVDRSILASVRNYLQALTADGIEVSFGVLFGSWADGRADKDSDIDVMVISRRFNGGASRDDRARLWYVAGRTDNRIEPIPCGEREWREDERIPIYEVARRYGQRIDLEADSPTR